MNDENELVDGFKMFGWCKSDGEVDTWVLHESFMDIGGNGSLEPAEPGTSLQDGPYIENLLGLAEHHQAQAVVMV